MSYHVRVEVVGLFAESRKRFFEMKVLSTSDLDVVYCSISVVAALCRVLSKSYCIECQILVFNERYC